MTLTSDTLVARILGPLHRSSQAAVRRLGAAIGAEDGQSANEEHVAADPPALGRTSPRVGTDRPAPDGPAPAPTLALERRLIALPGAAHPTPVDVAFAHRLDAAPGWAAAPRQPLGDAPSAALSDGRGAPVAPSVDRLAGGDVSHSAWQRPALRAHDPSALAPRSIPLVSSAMLALGGAAERPEPRAVNPATTVTSTSAFDDTHIDSNPGAIDPAAPAMTGIPRLGPIVGPPLPYLGAARAMPQLDHSHRDRGAIAAGPAAPTFDHNDVFVPAPTLSAVSSAVRGQAARIGRAVTPLLQRASGFAPPAPLGRDTPDTFDGPDTPDLSMPAQASTVFNVNVSLGSGGEPDALRDALTDVLRDCARRQGLDI